MHVYVYMQVYNEKKNTLKGGGGLNVWRQSAVFKSQTYLNKHEMEWQY